MTYDEYIAETTKNCMKALADRTNRELENIELIRKILSLFQNYMNVPMKKYKVMIGCLIVIQRRFQL